MYSSFDLWPVLCVATADWDWFFPFPADGHPFLDIPLYGTVATLILSQSDAEALRAKQKVTP